MSAKSRQGLPDGPTLSIDPTPVPVTVPPVQVETSTPTPKPIPTQKGREDAEQQIINTFVPTRSWSALQFDDISAKAWYYENVKAAYHPQQKIPNGATAPFGIFYAFSTQSGTTGTASGGVGQT